MSKPKDWLPEGMHRINFNAPIELYKRTQLEAEMQGRSAGWIARTALEFYLDACAAKSIPGAQPQVPTYSKEKPFEVPAPRFAVPD